MHRPLRQLILIVLILTPFLIIYNSYANADEDTTFAMMYITFFATDMRHSGNIIIEYYQDQTATMNLSPDLFTGHCGGSGEGTWNAKKSFFTANFMVNIGGDEQKIVFSISGITIFTSIPVLPDLSRASFPVLGIGSIHDPHYSLFEEETVRFWFLGIYSTEPIRVIN